MWKCHCLICRALVHPIISRVNIVSTKRNDVVVEQVEEPPKEFEAMNNIPQSTTSQPEQLVTKPTEQLQQTQQPVIVEVKLPQELIERMNQLDQEIINLRKEVVSLNDNFKSLIIEFKESIAELSSPFNILRNSRNGNSNGNGKNGNGKKGYEKPVTHPTITPTSFLEVLKIIYSMLGRMSKEQALMFIDGYVKVGLINDEVGKALSGVVELADNMRKSGLSLEDHLPYLYGIISALNIKDNLLSDYVLKELIKHGKSG
ncbi:MAG: hypothetical protein QXT01_04970 [Sulfolobales archaeon]